MWREDELRGVNASGMPLMTAPAARARVSHSAKSLAAVLGVTLIYNHPNIHSSPFKLNYLNYKYKYWATLINSCQNYIGSRVEAIKTGLRVPSNYFSPIDLFDTLMEICNMQIIIESKSHLFKIDF